MQNAWKVERLEQRRRNDCLRLVKTSPGATSLLSILFHGDAFGSSFFGLPRQWDLQANRQCLRYVSAVGLSRQTLFPAKTNRSRTPKSVWLIFRGSRRSLR